MTRAWSAAAVQRPIPAQFLRGSSAMMRCDALVLDASLRQSLVTVRSLGRRGLGVAAAETHDHAPAFASRWCQRGFVFPAKEGTDADRKSTRLNSSHSQISYAGFCLKKK